MERGQVALKLFLDELGIPFDVQTLDDRKRVQKAVYLGQKLSGVDLGYTFGWYIMGPYCPSLTRDYFDLAEVLGAGDSDCEGKSLRESARKKLAIVKPVLQVPQDISLPLEDWLELVASLHFLKAISKLSDQESYEILRKEKSHVYGFSNRAKEILIKNKFWPEN